MNISGVIPALITPFDKDFNVDYSALRALVNSLIEKGVNGFYACGSTAECFLLEDKERMQIMETVAEETNGRVPIIAHVGAISTAKAAQFAKHAASCGVTAVSSVPPFYFKFSMAEIARYYAAIADAAQLPLIIYSIPAFSGVAVTADNIGEILSASGAKGLKYTSYDLFELDKIKRKYPDLKCFNGHDECFVNALPLGIAGAIGSTFNVMPHKYMAIKKYFEAGEMAKASEMQREVNAIIEAFIKCGVNPSIKYVLTKNGIPCGDSRPPFSAITEEQKKYLDGFIPLINK